MSVAGSHCHPATSYPFRREDVLQGGDPMRLLRLNYALLALLWSATASASLPTYWGLGGATANIPTGSSRITSSINGQHLVSIGNNIGYGVSFEFGQYFGPRFGYNIRLVANDFFNNEHKKLVSKNIFPDISYSPEGLLISPYSQPWGFELTHQYLSAGVNYKYPRYDVVFNANVTIGRYNSGFTNWGLVFYVDELPTKDNPPGKDAFLSPGWEGQTISYNDVGTLGIELGVTKKIMRGLHGSVFYHYSSLDKGKVGVSSVQFAGFGIKYLWGRGR